MEIKVGDIFEHAENRWDMDCIIRVIEIRHDHNMIRYMIEAYEPSGKERDDQWESKEVISQHYVPSTIEKWLETVVQGYYESPYRTQKESSSY